MSYGVFRLPPHLRYPARRQRLPLATLTAPPAPQTVNLSLQTLSAAQPSLTVVAGGVTQTLALQTIAANALTPTTVPGAVSQTLALQTIAASVLTPTVTPGAVSQTLALQSVTASALTPTVTPGGVSQALALQSAATALRNITVIPGGTTTTLALQTLTASLLTPSVVTGGVTNLALQTLTASLRNTTVIPGGVVMGLRVDPPALDDDVTTLAQMAHRTVDELMSDDMSIAASLRNATASSVSAGTTNLALLTLAGTLRNTTVTPGPVVLGLRVAPPSLDDDVTTLAQMAHRTVDELMSDNTTVVASLRTATESTTGAGGPVTVNLALQTLSASLRNITVTSGTTANLALQTLTAALRNITVTGGPTTVPLALLQGAGLLLTANVSISGDTRPIAVVTLEVVPIASLSLEVVPTANVTLEVVPTASVTVETVPGAATDLEVVPMALVGVEP